MMWNAWVVAAVILGSAGGALAAERVEPRERPEAVRASLREAAEVAAALDDPAKLERFHALLQPIADHLHAVPAATDKTEARFHKLTLNGGEEGLDAFVFAAPAAAEGAEPGAYNLSWTFVMPTPRPQMVWYILPEKGTMAGFESFDKRDDERFDDADLPPKNFAVHQKLRGGRLRAGERYIIWFRFPEGGAQDVYVKLLLTPAR